LNWARSPPRSLRRARSKAALEASKITVFAQRIRGLGMLIQGSEEIPRRASIAAVNDRNTIALEINNR